MADATPSPEVIAQLATWFRRNGYVRRQNPTRLEEPYGSYEKGEEVRLVAESKAELQTIRRVLRAAGFEPGKPFTKAGQWRQPVYGRAEVARFLTLIGEPVPDPPTTPMRRRGPGRPRKNAPDSQPPVARSVGRPRKNAPPARIIRISATGPLVIPDFEGEPPTPVSG